MFHDFQVHRSKLYCIQVFPHYDCVSTLLRRKPSQASGMKPRREQLEAIGVNISLKRGRLVLIFCGPQNDKSSFRLYVKFCIANFKFLIQTHFRLGSVMPGPLHHGGPSSPLPHGVDTRCAHSERRPIPFRFTCESFT